MRDLEFSFRYLPFRGKQVLSLKALAFAYPDGPSLFSGLDISVNAGDRICVVGPNGKGKTTLLQLMGGNLQPVDGEVVYHPGVVSGFYEQTNIQTLHDRQTVEEEIQRSHPDVDRQLARNICGAMLFEGDEALKRIEVLSGGEKARVMLGKLLATPVNLLLLDEPTNHLDMESCDALLSALDHFDGAVIMVTHNEMFLHALAQRLIVFYRDGVDVFEGSYQDFLDKGGWGDDPGSPAGAPTGQSEDPDDSRMSKKKMRQLRSSIISENAKARKPVEAEIEKLESGLEREESRLASLNNEMIAASREQVGERIAALLQSIHQSQQWIDESYAELDDLYRRKEALDTELEQKLAGLEE